MLTLFQPRRRLCFYHRAVIPQALRPYFRGRRQVWKSLRTTDPDQARLLTLTLQARTQRLFLTLKREGQYMTTADIARLIADWKDTELERLEDVRVLHRFDEDQRSLMADQAIEQHEALDDTLEDNRYDRVASEADALLLAAGVPLLDPLSLPFKRLCRRLLLAKREVLREDIDRWQGVYKSQPVGRPTITSTPVQKASPLFSEFVETYFQGKTKAKRSIPEYRTKFHKFMESMGGDRPIGTITKVDHATPFVNALRKGGLKAGTVAQYAHTLGGLFTFAIRQGYIEKNPFSLLAPGKATIEKEALERRPFTLEELVQVFSTPHFLKQRLTRPARYWATLVCLFQLCRREEAAQLALTDLGEREEIPWISITDLGKDQSVKTKGSKRTIPIHSGLIALGFLDYVQTIRAQGHTRLFPQLKRVKDRYSDALGKWFAEHLDRVGLSQPELVMHSLRFGIHHLHQCGCPQDVAEMLTGHTAASVHNKYERRDLTPLMRLRSGLECMQFSDVVKALKNGESLSSDPRHL